MQVKFQEVVSSKFLRSQNPSDIQDSESHPFMCPCSLQPKALPIHWSEHFLGVSQRDQYQVRSTTSSGTGEMFEKCENYVLGV